MEIFTPQSNNFISPLSSFTHAEKSSNLSLSLSLSLREENRDTFPAKTRNGRLARSSFFVFKDPGSARRPALIRLVFFLPPLPFSLQIRLASLRDAEELNRVEDHAGNAFKYGGSPAKEHRVQGLTRWPGGSREGGREEGRHTRIGASMFVSIIQAILGSDALDASL